jgi:malate dehydrogenase
MFATSVAKAARTFSTSSVASSKVAVLGAAGGIGQPLSLLMKMDKNVSELALYDIVNAPGVAADCSHVDTASTVTGHVGDEQLGDALKGADVVVIPAGVPRKPGMTRDDLFNTNASIVQGLARAAAEHCPEACMLIISNPVNSTVPIVAETFKAAGVYDPAKVFGVTTLDVMRAQKFVADHQGWADAKVNVIGGHAGTTILPLLSQVEGTKWTDEDVAALSHRIQFGGDEVVQAKDGAGSATLSMALAGARFASSVVRALQGEEGIVECTFVESSVTDAPFFSSPVELGKGGVKEVRGFGDLSDFEKANFDEMLPTLMSQIEKGIAFAKDN